MREKLNIAIAQDWLISGGAERVVESLHKLYPDAPIYTSYCTSEWRAKLDNKVVTGYLQYWPFSKLRKFLPLLRIKWFEGLDLSEYDLVISCSSSGEAKAVRPGPNGIHINYCHAPTHFYWLRYDEYLKHPGFGILDPVARLGLKLLVKPLRKWDYKIMQKPDYIIANSSYTQAGIKKFYNRDSTVIFPPVDISRFPFKASERHGFVIAGRQTPYKRFDLVVDTCTKLRLPLTVIGKGPDHKRLISLGGPTIKFEKSVSDQQMPEFFSKAEAFLLPNVEDFGVVAVEALAAGTPVIAYRNGGPLDYLKEGSNGLFFDRQTISSLSETINKFHKLKFNYQKISKDTEEYGPDRFKKQIQSYIAQAISLKS